MRRGATFLATSLAAALALAAPLAAQQAASAHAGAGDTVHVSLEEAMAAARRQSPQATAALARASAADARVSEARSALLPQLGAHATSVTRSFNRQSFGIDFPVPEGSEPLPYLIGPFTEQDARVTAQMQLFDASSWQRLHAAKYGNEAAAAEADAAAADASMMAAQAYLGLARAQALLRARTADTLIAGRLLGIAGQQKEAGVATGIDVTRARVRMAAARTAWIEAAGAVDRARVALRRAMGSTSAVPIEVDSLVVTAPTAPTSADSLVALALTRRPELQAAQQRVAAARSARRAAGMQILPKLGLSGDYGYDGPRFGNSIATHTIAVQLSWNAWDGGRRGAVEDEQEAQLRETEAMARDRVLVVEAEARDAAVALATARSALATTRERLSLAQQELEQAEASYREGLSGSLDVITAQQGLVEARTDYIDAVYAADAAEVAARRAAGTLVPTAAGN